MQSTLKTVVLLHWGVTLAVKCPRLAQGFYVFWFKVCFSVAEIVSSLAIFIPFHVTKLLTNYDGERKKPGLSALGCHRGDTTALLGKFLVYV